MLSNLLSSTNPTREVPVEEAALYALLGFAIVFIGIVFLIFIVWLVGKIMTKLNPKTASILKFITSQRYTQFVHLNGRFTLNLLKHQNANFPLILK